MGFEAQLADRARGEGAQNAGCRKPERECLTIANLADIIALLTGDL